MHEIVVLSLLKYDEENLLKPGYYNKLIFKK
jgi:hypothetical protein